MDIWKWVWEAKDEANARGDYRLTELIEILPSHVVDNEYEKVDAIIPEATHLARQNNHKWLEIYFRHWNLQSRVLNRMQVKGMLPEAIDLVDFCHQEDTQGCPQSICVVQDLAKCYTGIDHLGYVEERLAVAEETLAKINPDWPCFDCIGSEYTSALIDQGKAQEALDWIKQSRKKALHSERYKNLFNLDEVAALIKIEDWEKAYQCAEKAENPAGGDGFIRSRKNYLTLTLSGLKRYDEALKYRLDFEEIKESCSYFAHWSHSTCLLVKAGKLNSDWDVDSQLDYMAEKLKSYGVIRTAIIVSHRQAELALLRERPLTVQRCIERIQSLIPELPKDLGASDDLQALRHRANTLKQQSTQWHFENSDDALKQLNDDIELNLIKLTSAQEQLPDSEEIIIARAKTLGRLNRTPEADSALQQFLEKHPDAENCMLMYGFSLLSHGNDDALAQLLAKEPEDNATNEYRMNWHWLQAHRAKKQNNNPRCQQHLDQILSANPNAYNCLRWSAELACELEDYAKSISLWDHLIKHFEDEQQSHWDRMIPSVLSNRWDLVRESIKALNLKYDLTETDLHAPIDMELESIRLQIEDENGDQENYLARRTSPVTARIIAINSPYDTEQRYGHEYVFNPIPFNQLDQKDDEGYACDSEGYYTLLFPAIKTIKSPEYEAFYIDGFYPGDQSWQEFTEQLKPLQGALDIRSSKEYCLEFEGKPHPAIYAFIAFPKAADKSPLLQLLDQCFSELTKPLIWPDLLDAAGKNTEAAKHRQIQEDYEMDE